MFNNLYYVRTPVWKLNRSFYKKIDAMKYMDKLKKKKDKRLFKMLLIENRLK